mmetsp:Transcript_141398/g.451567  ORF Transcript_141398/g.451567 Transcript_141398/m.451567 type:complete len:225 (+) Transcript_141398:440-1114(+)
MVTTVNHIACGIEANAARSSCRQSSPLQPKFCSVQNMREPVNVTINTKRYKGIKRGSLHLSMEMSNKRHPEECRAILSSRKIGACVFIRITTGAEVWSDSIIPTKPMKITAKSIAVYTLFMNAHLWGQHANLRRSSAANIKVQMVSTVLKPFLRPTSMLMLCAMAPQTDSVITRLQHVWNMRLTGLPSGCSRNLQMLICTSSIFVLLRGAVGTVHLRTSALMGA